MNGPEQEQESTAEAVLRSYFVNATVEMVGWVEIAAETPEQALELAEQADALDFEVDRGTARTVFNIEPQVETAPF